ncbi:sensor histidine kinase [Vulcaniibacterium tengchongense]|uniref:histidine kinase n=1 Tax=Vulcaniibacterium tengchongense TaxID=1273429 RepID=A0A3N4VFA2_9GAMM|nr:PAS domain S-box protein [Vulcaniibacterium tengchongense]RPE81338.1 PAS domain S-box-containing protein [Vulcaniibacterium tengchongense]
MSAIVSPEDRDSGSIETLNGLEALAHAEQAVLDAIPAAVYVCDAEGMILRFNRHAVRLWGRTPKTGDRCERFCGALRLYLPDGTHLPHDRTPMAHALLTGEPAYGQEVAVERPDGSRRIVLVDIEALRDEAGRITGAINCFRDITERKRAEEQVLRHRRDLEDFFENGAVGLHVVAADGTIVRANQAELDMLGYAPEEYIGRRITDFHVDGPVIEDILRRLRSGERIDKRTARLRARDGSIKHVQITSNAHFREGELAHTRCFTIDVTEQHAAYEALRESERQLRDILNAMPAAVYMTDAEGRITFYNEAAVAFSGRRPQLGSDEWCVSWKLYETDGTPLPHDRCPMAVALREQREIRGAEAIAERPDGTRVPFIPFPTPLRDENGQVVGAVNMLVDITQRKQAEEQQLALINELNHRVKNTLAAVQSIALQTFRASPDPQDFIDKFQGRLLALSHAHDLLTRRSWTRLGLSELLDAELAPYAQAGEPRVLRDGHDIALSPRLALTLVMALHELTTNAAKYGALSRESGRVALTWRLEGEGGGHRLRLEWRESGGPPVAEPAKRGFGTRFIERSIVRDLGGRVHLAFDAGGVNCLIDVPYA